MSPDARDERGAQHEMGDPLRALRAELAGVAPSPAFSARVRQRVEAARVERGTVWRSNWRWLVPAAAVAAVVIAVVALSRPQPETPQQISARGPIETPGIVATPNAPIAAPAPRETSQPVRSAARVARAVPTSAGMPAPTTNTGSGLEVITNQPALLRALWARVPAGATVVEASAAPLPETVPDIVVISVEVRPVVVKWLIEPQPTPGVVPIIRKASADTAERSEK